MGYIEDLAIEKRPKMRCDWASKSPSYFLPVPKDGREIDFLLEQNQTLYPIEVKKSATVQRQWIKASSVLEKLKCKVGPGVILCMTGQRLPLDEQNQAIPISVL